MSAMASYRSMIKLQSHLMICVYSMRNGISSYHHSTNQTDYHFGSAPIYNYFEAVNINYFGLNSLLVKLIDFIGTGCVEVTSPVQCFAIPQYISF